MPELAEVEYYRRRWDRGLGQRVRRVEVHPAKRVFRGTDATVLAEQLKGSRYEESWAHGKRMLFRFSRGCWVGVHLGMTGELSVEKANYVPAKHDHFVLYQSRQALVFRDPRQFGRVTFNRGSTAPQWWTGLPPMVTSRVFTLDRVATFLERRRLTPIKAVLLMQEMFPGIGNWMADEILWRARIHPAIKAGRIGGAVERLWQETRWVARAAVRIVAKDFADLPESWLFRHRWRPKGRCPRDGSVLSRGEVGGRTTAWCARCQPKL